MANLCFTYVKLNSTDENSLRFAIMFTERVQKINTQGEVPQRNSVLDNVPDNYLGIENYATGGTGWCIYTNTEPPLEYIETLSRTYRIDLEGYFHNPEDSIHGEYSFGPGKPARVDYQEYSGE